MGAALLIFSLLPIYRLLDAGGEAPFRQANLEIAEATLQLAWWGSLFVILVAILLAFLFSDGMIRVGRVMGEWVCRPGLPLFAAFAGLLAFVLSVGVAEGLYQGLYTNVDEIASAIQARYMATGRIAGPDLLYPEAWIVPNTLLTDLGWVSQYPPSHLAILGLFFRMGLPTLMGPILMGLTVWLLALSYPRLLPGQPAVARTATILTSLSPFLLFFGGGAFSHLTAGAAGAGVLYASLRAREGNAAWGLAVGCAVGVMVSARPLIGLVLGTALPLMIWGPILLKGRIRWMLRRLGATGAGGFPFAILLGSYNHLVFGGPARFGYLAAFGDSHKLGFHLDPWGYMYGMESAVAFTSIDLLALGVQLLETPLPLTVIIGSYLLLGLRLPKGSGTILAWAFLPLLTNAFYWFHNVRMMFEASPAWILLAVLSVREIVSWSESRGHWSRRLGQVTTWAFAVSILAAVAWGIPGRWQTYSWTQETLDRIVMPKLPTPEPSIVFVHSSWKERVSSRLQGAGGMRQDSIVSALRRNTSCQLHRYTDAREFLVRGAGASGPLPEVDLSQEVGAPEGLLHRLLGPDVTIRTREGETLTPDCMREAQADRFGTVALAPLLWQGDLPGDLRGGPLFVRDLGPEANAEIMAIFPQRPAFVFSPFAPSRPPEIAPYDEAMRVLWGESPQ